jgi:hypothetical protein
MGQMNPLADIKNVSYIHSTIQVSDEIPAEYKTYINHGMLKTLLPYCQQDTYDRNLEDRTYQAIVLENAYLKAVFLPELGGRLWSLIDKTADKELLYKNPVVQPGNLALRNKLVAIGEIFNLAILLYAGNFPVNHTAKTT